MVRKVLRKKRTPLSIISIALILVGSLILLATVVTWQPYDLSSLATRLNLLTLSLGVLYILFGYILLKTRL
jgi:hypothetical protein